MFDEFGVAKDNMLGAASDKRLTIPQDLKNTLPLYTISYTRNWQAQAKPLLISLLQREKLFNSQFFLMLSLCAT